MNYFEHVLILVGIYFILAQSLNLLAGYAGMLSLAHGAFYGIGAYAAALLALRLDVPFWLSLPTSAAITGAIGFLIAWPALRVRGDYLVLATFAFQVLVGALMVNLTGITGGPVGLPGIPAPILFGWKIGSGLPFLMLTLITAVFTHLIVASIVRSPFGRVLHAIREDEVFAESLGKNTQQFKIAALTVSAALAALSGTLYAHYITYVDPTSFTVMESIFVLSMVIIGGPGSLWGPLIGAFVLVTLPEALRFVGLPNDLAANLRQITYGVLLVAVMMYRPTGLVGKFGFNR